MHATRSTSDPDYEGGNHGIISAKNREHRRDRLHYELSKLGIDTDEIESNPERFGTSALRTYNSFLFPKSPGALAVAESPTRAKVVANNISFLIREYKADRERWLRNVDREQRRTDAEDNDRVKHSITIVLDNVRSAPNVSSSLFGILNTQTPREKPNSFATTSKVGNILRLSEAAQVESVRLCGECCHNWNMSTRLPLSNITLYLLMSNKLLTLRHDTKTTSSKGAQNSNGISGTCFIRR